MPISPTRVGKPIVEIIENSSHRFIMYLEEVTRSVRTSVVQLERKLLNALTAEQLRRDALETQRGAKPDDWFTFAELGDWLKIRTSSRSRAP